MPGIGGQFRARRLVPQTRFIVIDSPAEHVGVLPRTLLRQQGLVVADNLTPQKARVLAMLALTRTDDPSEVQRFFDEY